jgi:hypothetical protein
MSPPLPPPIVLAAAGASWDRTGTWTATPLEHRVENLTTCRLERVSHRLADGSSWSAVAKTLHPASMSPAFASIPPEHHAQVLEDLCWLDEPRVYRSGLADVLPSPLRMPEVFEVTEADDHQTIWMEDVADVGPWDLDRYHRTAGALGTLAGRWPGGAAARDFGLGGRDIGRLFGGKVLHHDLPVQERDEFWSDSAVAAAVDGDHRDDLHRLADAVPGLLARLERVPTGVCHGDACPDNFREPGDGSIVALDWSYGNVGAVGSDLAQLFVGRYESGTELEEPEDVARAVLDGFCEGLDSSRASVETEDVLLAWSVHLAIRSAFSLLVLDREDLDEDERAALLASRGRAARFALDLALARV